MQDHVLLLTKTAQERMASFLLDLAKRPPSAEEIKVPMSRQDIADYLGLTIETMSRTLTQFETQGGHGAADVAADRSVQPSRFDPPQRLTRPTRQGLTPQIGSAGRAGDQSAEVGQAQVWAQSTFSTRCRP
jgi:hypothetical protein